MSNRREFIFQGLAVAAATGIATQPALAAAPAGGDLEAGTSPVTRVVTDTRYDDSVAFARVLAGRGHALEPIEGDVTRLWLDRLEPALRAQPAAIAGLTTERSFLCLEMFASSHGLRTVFHAEHLYLGGGHIEHSLRAPAELLARAAPLANPATHWPEHAAQLVAAYRTGRRPAPGRRLYATRITRAVQPEVEALVSWVLAPLPRA
jgi:hypothetical protein